MGVKRYQFNTNLLNVEACTNILVRALTVSSSAAFSLSLALLPPSTIPYSSNNTAIPANAFIESVQKLAVLNSLLESAQYGQFWSVFERDDLYVDLVADVTGFEDLIRIRIAGEIGKAFRVVDAEVLSDWLNLGGGALWKFCSSACGWRVDGQNIMIPANSENEAKSEVRGERVGVDMFGRVFRRAFEQPA